MLCRLASPESSSEVRPLVTDQIYLIEKLSISWTVASWLIWWGKRALYIYDISQYEFCICEAGGGVQIFDCYLGSTAYTNFHLDPGDPQVCRSFLLNCLVLLSLQLKVTAAWL